MKTPCENYPPTSAVRLTAARIPIILMAFVLFSTFAVAAVQEDQTQPLISNSFFDTELRQAIQDIAVQAGLIIVCSPEVSGYVSCELSDVPLERALKIVLAGTGFVVKKTPDYYLICSQDPTGASFPLISGTALIKLSHIKANTACNLLGSQMQAYVRPDPASNSVCITAPQEMLERIKSDLKLMDQPAKRVMLDSRIVVLDRGTLLNMGVKWKWPEITGGGYTNNELYPHFNWDAGIGSSASGTLTNALLLTLNLLAQNDEANIVACPRVMGLDGKKAEIKVTTEEYFEIVTDGYADDRELEKIEVGTVLSIVPHVGKDNKITLDLSAEVSDVIARGANNLPMITRRLTNSTVRIEDGGTAIVAGLLDNRKRVLNSRVPGLGRLPIVGNVFRNKNREETSKQVAIFVTARLLPDNDEALPVEAKTMPQIMPVNPREFKEALRKSLQNFKNG